VEVADGSDSYDGVFRSCYPCTYVRPRNFDVQFATSMVEKKTLLQPTPPPPCIMWLPNPDDYEGSSW